MPIAEAPLSISVKTAFTAEGEGTCYARTLPVKVSQCTEDLRNLSLCMHLFSHFVEERGANAETDHLLFMWVRQSISAVLKSSEQSLHN